jgi:hypothetical protein
MSPLSRIPTPVIKESLPFLAFLVEYYIKEDEKE